ncbi:Hypothetical protein EAG7_01402 [Klebsiella aerogenes]|nr:Hypothetical protein EAG7_01402 [Klebsiella aerogenes]CCG29860.1 hypothetical protein [Klebsiella aerogenes EA1509E]
MSVLAFLFVIIILLSCDPLRNLQKSCAITALSPLRNEVWR